MAPALLSRLSDALRRLSDPNAIVLAAMSLLREHLGADRCAWAEVEADENHFSFVGVATAPGVPSVAGRFPVSAFGQDSLRRMRSGAPIVTADVLTIEGDAGAYRATGTRALIATPLHKDGRFVAGTGVHMMTPRAWTSEEVELVREVSERCWESVERARVERALRESEARFRAVVDSQSEMLCRFRPDGTITFVNRAYAQARGTTPEVLLTQNFWEFIAPDDRAGVRAMLERLSPESPEVRIENRFSTAQGERWTLWSNRALAFDDRGHWTEAQSAGIDITDRKRMEEALRDADRRKDEFLAMLAHELRNPLFPIRNAAQVLKLLGGDDPRLQRAREMIERQTQHLTRLVDDLLDVSRITQGKVRLSREVLDMAGVVNRAIEISRPLLEARKHLLTVSLPPSSVRVEGDMTRLVQVIGNLLTNAAKYTDERGHIELEVGSDGAGHAVIRVRDNGRGISAELLPHVFDLFVQAHRSLDRAQGGLGIGLTLVRQLVELHGGNVSAASAGPGKGSEFVVRLPLHRDREISSSRAGREDLAGGSRALRVLIVEDNADAADSLAMVLELAGHEVRVARDGVEGLEAALAIRPDLVLCDIGLPRMDGYALASRLRQAPELAGTRMVAVSGYGLEDDRRRAREAGFDTHVTKPVDPSALHALLEAMHGV